MPINTIRRVEIVAVPPKAEFERIRAGEHLPHGQSLRCRLHFAHEDSPIFKGYKAKAWTDD